jgi:hypothetical protein
MRKITAPTLCVCMAFATTLFLLSSARDARAQESATTPDTTIAQAEERYGNSTAGEFTPARGFDIFRSDHGSLNISVYGLFRYLNQMPGEQAFTDHLGRTRTVKARNDLNWHRTMVWLSGFFYNPKLNYTITVWSLPTTQQTLAFGVLRYTVSKPLTMGVGIGPNLTNRSMAGTWPFWPGSDRQMGEEAVRAGFSSSFFVTGQPADGLFYTGAITTNLSQLGVTASNDTRDMGYSATLWWMPTTKEFGPRGGFGDLEEHQRLATRFGVSAAHARESRATPLSSPNPNETQVRLSDGVYAFEQGALADSVTVNYLDYDALSFDAGFKYKGFCLQGELLMRRLSKFEAFDVHQGADYGTPFSLADDSIVDKSLYGSAGYMVVERKLMLYAIGSYLFDEFERNPWEAGGGASFYPYGNRSWRVNMHILHIDRSPAGSNFGYYTAGQTGTTFSLGTDILL